MGVTKRGRIKKNLTRCKAKETSRTTVEETKPRVARMMSHTVISYDADGKIVRQKTEIIVVDNTFGRGKRLEREIERLTEALKGGGKKPRMKGFAHKKSRAAEIRVAKAAAKQKRGKEKKG